MFKIAEFAAPSEVILFHGSPSGLDGPIQADYPGNGRFRDFGPGFSCAGSELAAMGLLCPYAPEDYASRDSLPDDYADPFLYTLRADLSGLRGMSIAGPAWILLAAWNRGRLEREMCPVLHDSMGALMEGVDLVIAPVFDDWTFASLELFLSDYAAYDSLVAVLLAADAGTMHVFRSQELAGKLEILGERRLDLAECGRLAAGFAERQEAWKEQERRIKRETRDRGLFLSDIIERINEDGISFPAPAAGMTVLELRP